MLSDLLTDMQLLRCRNNFVEIADNGIALNFRYTDDFSDETRVKENRLPACYRVYIRSESVKHW